MEYVETTTRNFISSFGACPKCFLYQVAFGTQYRCVSQQKLNLLQCTTSLKSFSGH